MTWKNLSWAIRRSPRSNKRNQDLQRYAAIVAQVAHDRGLAFVDLFTPTEPLFAEKTGMQYEIDDKRAETKRVVAPSVPDRKDLVPATGNRREQLAAWRADIRRACTNEAPELPVNRELQPVIRRYQLRFELFDELLKGVEMDLDVNRYAGLPSPTEGHFGDSVYSDLMRVFRTILTLLRHLGTQRQTEIRQLVMWVLAMRMQLLMLLI